MMGCDSKSRQYSYRYKRSKTISVFILGREIKKYFLENG
jgi:hypothetical protein